MTTMYFDVREELRLIAEEDIGDGSVGYIAYEMDYWIHPDDFINDEFFISDDGVDKTLYLWDTKNHPLWGDRLIAFADYPFEISTDTGSPDVSGNLVNLFTGSPPPAYYYFNIPGKIATAKSWSVSDGTQTIYFDAEYEGNEYVNATNPWEASFVGFGDDVAEKSTISGRGDYPFDLHFKENVTAALVISAYPMSLFSLDKGDKEKSLDLAWLLGGTLRKPAGDLIVRYPYRPLEQPASVRHKYSMEFDGGTERLQSQPDNQTLDIVNRWAIAAWVKPASNDGNEQQVFCLGNDSNTNRIHLFRDTQDVDYPWVIDIMDASTNQKTYYFAEALDMDEWYLIAARWNTGALTVYVNGVEVVPTDTTQDDMVTMTDTARYMAVGGKNHVSASDGFDGRIFWAAAWSVNVHPAALLYLAEHPQHYLLESGEPGSAYMAAHAAGLQHWYRPGRHVSPDLGKDYGASTFDLDDEKDVTDSNRVEDYPEV